MNKRKSLFDTPVVEATLINPAENVVVVVDNLKFNQPVPEFDLTLVSDQDIVQFGSETQKETSQVFDKLLAEMTKGSNPVLFELFRQLEKGIADTNVGELENEIKASLQKTWFQGLLDTVGLSSVSKRLEKANVKVGGLLKTKSASLLDLTKDMEAKMQLEVQRLISDSKILDTLASDFRKQIQEYGFKVTVGRNILEHGKLELGNKEQLSLSSGDPLQIEDSKRFSQKVSLFESRLLMLETVLRQAPAELEAIRLGQGALIQTLLETSSSSLQEFNTIKSVLLKLAVSHQVATVQGANAQRRELADKLQTHGTNLLGQTAVNAAQAQGLNRLDDANKLLAFATNLNSISKRVEDEKKLNQTRFAEARAKLEETRKLLQ